MASGTGVGPPRPVRERQGQNNPQLNNTQAPPKLEFHQAMKDFKNMFPTLDDEIIEAVLRANNGLVDATIDQLLSMGAGSECEINNFPEASDFPSLPSYAQTTERDEPPPAYTPRADEGVLLDIPVSTECAPPAFTSITDVRTTRAYKAWNPPLLGQLPEDFLRLDVTESIPISRTETSNSTPLSNNEQFLEDEKMALYLQNEEFMRELSRNKEFLTSLERDQSRSSSALQTPDHHSSDFRTSDQHREETIGSADSISVSPGSEEDFKEKLKHMGKSTRRKFNQLAKVFSRKKRPIITSEGSGMSTTNLLQDYEDDSDDDDELLRDHKRLDAVKESDSEDEEQTHTSQRNSRSERDHNPVEFFAEDNEFQYKPENSH